MLGRVKDWYRNLPGFWRGVLTAVGLLLLAPLVAMVVKALLGLAIVGVMLLFQTREVRIGPEHYQYTYKVVEDWRREQTGTQSDRENLFGFGEYLYNSHLLLFPRETPATLDEYYFAWESMGFDVDGFAVYFTCRLDEAAWQGFTQGLADFAIATDVGVQRPLYDTEHFQHPTYILQWLDAGEKWEVLEYIMLDEANRTAVFVYNTLGMREEIEENSAYTTTPATLDLLGEQSRTGFTFDLESLNKHFEGFSVYDGFENAEYDLSFLDYLN